MAESKKTTKSTPIADVAHPGKSAPADNARSLIINRPMLQDPMMVEDKTKPDDEKPVTAEAKVSREITVKPLAEPEPVADMPDKSDKTDEPKQPTPAKKAEKAEEPEKPEEPAETKTDNPSPAAEQKAKQVDEDAELALQAKHEAEIQKTIDSKKYFLPINSVEKRRSARFVALGIILAVLLLVAWADIALDAGLIHLGGLKPLTHLFSS